MSSGMDSIAKRAVLIYSIEKMKDKVEHEKDRDLKVRQKEIEDLLYEVVEYIGEEGVCLEIK